LSPPSVHQAAPAIVELDGWTLEPFDLEDAPLLAELLALRGHRYILEVPPDPALLRVILTELVTQPWTQPMTVVREDAFAGFATTALANVRALHTSIGALFVDPGPATLPLAMYVRHLFWSYPLHRLHTQIPDLDLTREYIALLTSIGFVEEGRLPEHALVGGQVFDVVSLGLLRSDFDRWTQDHEPRLSLPG
jgi:hypothetical protein